MDISDLDLEEGAGCANQIYSAMRGPQVDEMTDLDKTKYVSNWLGQVVTTNPTFDSNAPCCDDVEVENQTVDKSIIITKPKRYKKNLNKSDTSSHSSSVKNEENSELVTLVPSGHPLPELRPKRKSTSTFLSNSVQSRSSMKHSSSPKSSDSLKSQSTSSTSAAGSANCINQETKKVVAKSDTIKFDDWEAHLQETGPNDVKSTINNSECTQNHIKRALGFCMCPNCNTDIPLDLVAEERKGPGQAQEQHTRCKPDPLVRETEIVLQSVMTSVAKKVEDLFNIPLLVHGQTICNPQREISKSNLHRSVQKCLSDYNYEHCKPVQSYGWLGILRGSNACIVHSAGTGKTLTYIPPLLSLLYEPKCFENLPDFPGAPLLIVLTNTTTVAEQVYSKFCAFLKGNPKMVSKVWSPTLPLNQKGLRELKRLRSDVLITSIETLIVLLQGTVILKRLVYLVVENIDIILEKFQEKFERIIKGVSSMLDNRNNFRTVQFVSTSERWTKRLEDFVRKLYSFPLIIIGNPMQAALYGRADISLKYMKRVEKADALSALLKENCYSIRKSIVVCKLGEVHELEQKFASCGISFNTITDDMRQDELKCVRIAWSTAPNGKFSVLISTDKALRADTGISDASLLVHYSLPPTWSIFSNRFGTLVGSYLCPMSATFREDKFFCKIITYVDESSEDRFAPISKFFISNNLKVPEYLLTCCEEAYETSERSKIERNVSLCKNLLVTGSCSIAKCPHRHKFDQSLDNVRKAPCNGYITGKLIHMAEANQYFIKILEQRDADGEVHKFADHTNAIDSYLSELRVFEPPNEITPGGWYLYVADKLTIRCTVIKILKYISMTNTPDEVEIFGIDNGMKYTTSVGALYSLPKELNEIPAIAIRAFVANIIPPYQESAWTRNTNRIINQQLAKFGEKATCQANVLLRINDTVWLDDFRVHQADIDVCHASFVLSVYLKQNRLHVMGRTMERLYALCSEAGMELPDYEIKKAPDVVKAPKLMQNKPRWAFMPRDELSSVIFSSASSANNVYVKLTKFNRLLQDLEKDLTKSINELKKPPLPRDSMIPGKYYAVLDDYSGKYTRVSLRSIEEDTAICFSVDYGDIVLMPVCDLKFLYNEFIDRLPFQAIECSLFGIKSLAKSEEVVDFLHDYSYESNMDYHKTFYTKYMGETMVEYAFNTITKYDILLMDFYSGQPTSLNHVLVERGMAEPSPHDALQLKLPEPTEIPDASTSSDPDDNSLENEFNLQKILELHPTDFNEDDFMYIDGNMPYDDAADLQPKAVKRKTDQEFLPIVAATSNASTMLPKIQWHQNATEVFLKFQFIENNDYAVKVARKLLTFSTLYHGDRYELSEFLFANVRNQIHHETKTRFIMVTLKKQKEEEWVRLFSSEARMLNVSYDKEKVYAEESDSDDEFKVLQSEDIDQKFFEHIDISPEGQLCEFYSDNEDESDYSDSDEKEALS